MLSRGLVKRLVLSMQMCLIYHATSVIMILLFKLSEEAHEGTEFVKSSTNVLLRQLGLELASCLFLIC